MPVQAKNTIELIGATPKSFFGVAIPIAIHLGWSIEELNENEVVFATPASFPTWGELVTVHIENGEAVIKSQGVYQLLFFDFGKNRENITLFIEEYAKRINLNKIAEYEHRFEDALRLWRQKATNK